MSDQKINPMVKLALELGPIVAFFIAYGRMKDKTYLLAGTEYSGFILATGAFIPLLMITTLVLWRLTGSLSKMQLMTLVLVVVFGGLTIWFNDERFFKMKPTIIYVLFGGILGIGLMRGQSYLQYVMEEVMPMQPEGWMILTRRFCGFFFALAILNEAIWRSMSTDAWVNFKTFGLTLGMFALIMTQAKLFETYKIEEQED